MAIFTVTMTHPEGEGWNTHLCAHVEYLRTILAQGSLLASGPLKHTTLRTGFLIMSANDRREVEQIVAGDPFATEGLIIDLVISEWDPVFGAFHDASSRQLPGGMGTMDLHE